MDTWDAIVVGAGPSGILAAEVLHKHGLRVLVLDGGPQPKTAIEIPDIDETAWAYESVGSQLHWLRVRAVGGASLAWGGWCNRFPDQVFRRAAWPIGADDLAASYTAVEKRIQVRPEVLGTRFSECGEALGLDVVQMCTSSVLGRAWNALQSPIAKEVCSNAVALSIEPRGAAPGVLKVFIDGQIQQLQFELLMLSCSPVETARLLLASKLESDCPRIGRGLTYHPVAGYALIEPEAEEPEKTGAALLVREDFGGVDTALAFAVELTGPTLFRDLASDLRASLQVDEGIAANSLVTFIHGLGELKPHEQRYVDLSDSCDAFGRPVPRINLGWLEQERRMIEAMQTTALRIAETLANGEAKLVEYLDPLDSPMLFHEAGTCAFGISPDAACDPLGRLNVDANVWIADASVFPSPGDRHPTLTILAHATRAAAAAAETLRC